MKTPKILRGQLARSLILRFLALTLTVAGVLTLLSGWAFNRLEAISHRIDMDLAIDRLRDDMEAGVAPGWPNHFLYGEPNSASFPDDLRPLPPGFHMVNRKGRNWLVMVEDIEDQRYILLRDYTDYLQSQRIYEIAGLLCLAASLVLALALGYLATRRVIRPIERLSRDVQRRSELPPGTQLATQYPGNEIGQLATAFDAAYNALEEALLRERLFTADVGHELRTPLMSGLSTCELLAADPALDDATRTRVARIEDALQDMQQRVDVYLMLARGRQDGAAFPHAPLHNLAQEQWQAWQPQAERRGIHLRLDSGSSAAPGAPGYPVPLLRSVLSNLIRNALQYAGSGAEVRISHGWDWLEVCDDGPGIAQDLQEALFSPFVRGDTSDGRPEGNLGLGLSMVQRICRHQGWHLRLHSRPGQGSRFVIEMRPGARP